MSVVLESSDKLSLGYQSSSHGLVWQKIQEPRNHFSTTENILQPWLGLEANSRTTDSGWIIAKIPLIGLSTNPPYLSWSDPGGDAAIWMDLGL